MRTSILLVAVLPGCWPYLSGPYEDYVDTDAIVDTDDPDTRDPDTGDTDDPDTETPTSDGPVLLAVATTTDLLGGYWEGAYDSELIIFGFAPSGSAFSVADSYGLVRGQCRERTGYIDEQIVDSSINMGGGQTITLSAGGETRIAYRNNDFDVWVSVRDESRLLDNTRVTPSSVITLNAGTVDGTVLLTPSNFTVTAPNMDTPAPPTVSPTTLNVSWTGTGSDDVMILVTLIDASSNPLAQRYCLASSSSMNVNLGSIPQITSAAGAVIAIGRIRRSTGSLLGTADATHQGEAVLYKQGVVLF